MIFFIFHLKLNINEEKMQLREELHSKEVGLMVTL